MLRFERMPLVRSARRILLVEDETDIASSLKTGLERKGFIVDTYGDPKKALANVKPNQYDLAIFDIWMPEMNGFELYREFKKLDGQTAVCFFTAFEVHDNEFEKMFPDVHVKAFLKKPMTIAHLAKRLNELIDGDPNRDLRFPN